MNPEPETIRLLLLEGDTGDAELEQLELRRAGLAVSADIIEREEDFQQAIRTGDYDLVLADDRLPGWSGLQALEWLRGNGLSTPFILISGRLNEEAALECVEKGASDWVRKDRLARLPIAVRHALKERALREQRARAERALEASEARFRLLVERSMAGIFRATLDGAFLSANPALARMLGCASVEELLAGPASALFSSLEEQAHLVTRLQREGALSDAEIRVQGSDGSPVWLLVNANLAADGPGGSPVAEGTIFDITGRKRAEDRIVRLNRLYSVISHLNQATVRIADASELLHEVCRIAVTDGRFRMAWVGRVEESTGLVAPLAWNGFEDGYLANLRISVIDDPADQAPMGRALREGRHFVSNDLAADPRMAPWQPEAVRRGYRCSAAFPLYVRGRLFGALGLYAGEPGFFDQENIELLEEVAADVSFALENIEREEQRKRAEAERARLFLSEQAARAQAAAEARFHELLEAAPDAIFEVDAAGRIRLLNAATEKLFGYSRDELIGQPLEDLLPGRFGELHAARRAAWASGSQQAGTNVEGDLWGHRKDGSLFPVEASLSPAKTAEGDVTTCILRDITERRRAERALVESNRRTTRILESITDAFFAVDRDWRFTYLNRKAEQMLARKREELLGHSIWEQLRGLAGSVFEEQFRQAAAERRPGEFTAFYTAGRIWAEVHVYPSEDGLSVYVHDITARKELEEQFRQSQKLEALGRLAGGVAHDFNNLLTIIGGYGQMALEALGARSPLRRDVEPIVEAATRASALTRQLLAFSRRQPVQPRVLSLNRLVGRMNRMLRRLIGEDIELEVVAQPDLPPVTADPGQLEQVIMNLAVNARDAMPQGGRLTIATSQASSDDPRSGIPSELPHGNYVVLSIADTGTGMDAEVLSHIFEPFFSTKPRGKGTGLGLSTAYGIIRQSGGAIAVDTAPDQGATFRIYLPSAGKAPVKAGQSRGAQATPQRGTETILLVEDDPEVRRLARGMLSSQGYKVLEAAGGQEALALWREHAAAIDLLVADVIMPKMSGRELAEQLTAEQPRLKVLFVSGYTDDVIARHGLLEGRVELLQKPYTRKSLARHVRLVLDGPQSAPDGPPYTGTSKSGSSDLK